MQVYPPPQLKLVLNGFRFTVEPGLNVDTFGTILKCPDYQGVLFFSQEFELKSFESVLFIKVSLFQGVHI